MSFLTVVRQASRSATRSQRARASPAFLNTYRVSPFVRTIVTKKYTTDHEAVVYNDETNVGVVSITDYAQKSLGDVVFVELPAVGTKVSQGDQIGAVESVKAASDIYSPVSGTIVEINEVLGDKPGLINKSPEDQAWLCKIELSEPKEIDDLMTLEEYKTHAED